MAHFAKQATTKVASPSRMKIHAQDFLPPTPSILLIPKARRPPKAPAAVAAEKNRAILKPHSCLRYLLMGSDSDVYWKENTYHIVM